MEGLGGGGVQEGGLLLVYDVDEGLGFGLGFQVLKKTLDVEVCCTVDLFIIL